jgi:UDP-2,3-diacylglucosamine hydrolase
MERIGLVAGSGRFPVLFAQAAARNGRTVVAAAHEGETDPELERHVSRLSWVKLGQLGRIADVLRESGCAEAVFCGGLRKARLLDLRPDWLGVKVLAGLRSFGDDAALRAIADALEREGIRVVSPLPLVPELLARRGPLGRRRLSDEQRADAELGFAAARALGAIDIGQTVVVRRGVVLAVEAVEGTDACIVRGGFFGADAVVVKAFKPRQDARFDVPAVGVETIAAMQSARCSALAIEAGKALVLDREAMAAAADDAGIAIEGMEVASGEQGRDAERPAAE